MSVFGTGAFWVALLAIFVGLPLLALFIDWAYHRLRIYGRRLRSRIVAWGQALKRVGARLRRTLFPYAHTVFKGLLYVVIILVVSLAAPQLTNVVGDILSLIPPKECEVLRNCLTISVVAGSSTGLLFIFARERPLSFANRVLARLSGSASPDGGALPQLVPFSPSGKALRISDSEREYTSIKYASLGVDEWIVVLPQIGASRFKYTTECLEQQLERLLARQEEENKKRRKNCYNKMLAVNWVCLVSSEGGFQAFQPFKTFCFHMRVKHNARYAAILNTITEQDMAKAIQIEIDLSNKFKITDASGVEREALVPDAIPDLDRTWIRKGAANDEIFEVLIEEKKGKAMLISACGSSAPIGVITATELAKLVLYEPLTKAALYQSHMATAEKGKLFGDNPP